MPMQAEKTSLSRTINHRSLTQYGLSYQQRIGNPPDPIELAVHSQTTLEQRTLY